MTLGLPPRLLVSLLTMAPLVLLLALGLVGVALLAGRVLSLRFTIVLVVPMVLLLLDLALVLLAAVI